MSRLKIYIQVGAPRSGTTFMQKYVYRSHPEIEYIDHVKIWNRWMTAIFSSRKDNIVVCEESLTGSHTLTPAAALSRLKDVFPSAKIILVQRDLTASLVKSFYSQMVRCGENRSLKTFLAGDGGERIRRMYDYKTIEASLVSLYGQDNVLKLNFRDFTSNRDFFLSQIACFMEIGDFPVMPNTKVINKSSSLEETFFIRKWNRLFKFLFKPLSSLGVPVPTLLLWFNDSYFTRLLLCLLGKVCPLRAFREEQYLNDFLEEAKS